jgi:hypothetical protein
MDTAYAIRHKMKMEGKSIRSVAHEMSITRNTVARYPGLSVSGLKENVSRPRQVRQIQILFSQRFTEKGY